MGMMKTGGAAFAHQGGYGLMRIPLRFVEAAFCGPPVKPPAPPNKINFDVFVVAILFFLILLSISLRVWRRPRIHLDKAIDARGQSELEETAKAGRGRGRKRVRVSQEPEPMVSLRLKELDGLRNSALERDIFEGELQKMKLELEAARTERGELAKEVASGKASEAVATSRVVELEGYVQGLLGMMADNATERMAMRGSAQDAEDLAAGLRSRVTELEARLHVATDERDRLASRVIHDDETSKQLARVFERNTASFSDKEKLYTRDMELMRGRVQELDRDLADASAGRKEQKNYASQLKEMLERRSEELRGVRGLLAAANKRLEELEARLRPQRQQEGAGPAYANVGDTDRVEERIRAVERSMAARRRNTKR